MHLHNIFACDYRYQEGFRSLLLQKFCFPGICKVAVIPEDSTLCNTEKVPTFCACPVERRPVVPLRVFEVGIVLSRPEVMLEQIGVSDTTRIM